MKNCFNLAMVAWRNFFAKKRTATMLLLLGPATDKPEGLKNLKLYNEKALLMLY
jgi:hypothetical protein